MRKWFLLVGLVFVGTLAFAACGGDGEDANTESTFDGDDSPQVSDDARLPGTDEFRVTISFDETANQVALDEAGRLLAIYDSSAEYSIQESFPPTGVATLTTDADNFCESLIAELDMLSYVTVSSCEPRLEPGDVDNDGLPPGELTDADCDPVPLRSDCGIDPDVCNQVHNIDACTGEGEVDPGISVSPVCAPDFPDCVDVIVVCDAGECDGTGEDELPVAPPDALPSTVGEYTAVISFNETVQQGNLDETAALIRDFDPDATYVIQESFPPTGVATFTAETEDVCLVLTQELEQASFVASVSCGPRPEPGDANPEEPVVNDLE